MMKSFSSAMGACKAPGGSPRADPDFVHPLEDRIDAVVKLKDALPIELGGFTRADAAPAATK